MDVKRLRERVADRTEDARGSSYGSVWSYVNDPPTNPREEIVRALAVELGVTFEWLATGAGPRTPQEAAILEGREAAEKPELLRALEDLPVYQAMDGEADVQLLMALTVGRLGLGALEGEELKEALWGFQSALGFLYELVIPGAIEDRGPVIRMGDVYFHRLALSALQWAIRTRDSMYTDEARAKAQGASVYALINMNRHGARGSTDDDCNARTE